jgi:hypothetical protein
VLVTETLDAEQGRLLVVGYLFGFVAVVYGIAIAVGLMKRWRRAGQASKVSQASTRAAGARHSRLGVSEPAGDPVSGVPIERLRNIETSIDMLDQIVNEGERGPARTEESRVLPLRGRLRR